MNVRREAAYSNGLVGLKKVGICLPRFATERTSEDAALANEGDARLFFWWAWNRASWIHTTTWDSNSEVLPWSFRPLTSEYASWQCTGTFISRSTRIFDGKNIPTLPHPPYSAHCDFFLFTKLKSVLKWMLFDDLEEIKANTTRILKSSTSKRFQIML